MEKNKYLIKKISGIFIFSLIILGVVLILLEIKNNLQVLLKNTKTHTYKSTQLVK